MELFDIEYHDCSQEEINEFYEIDEDTRKTIDALQNPENGSFQCINWNQENIELVNDIQSQQD